MRLPGSLTGANQPSLAGKQSSWLFPGAKAPAARYTPMPRGPRIGTGDIVPAAPFATTFAALVFAMSTPMIPDTFGAVAGYQLANGQLVSQFVKAPLAKYDLKQIDAMSMDERLASNFAAMKAARETAKTAEPAIVRSSAAVIGEERVDVPPPKPQRAIVTAPVKTIKTAIYGRIAALSVVFTMAGGVYARTLDKAGAAKSQAVEWAHSGKDAVGKAAAALWANRLAKKKAAEAEAAINEKSAFVAAAQEVEKNNELFLDVLDVLDGKKPMGMPVPAGQSAVVDRVRFGNLLQNRAKKSKGKKKRVRVEELEEEACLYI